MKFVWPPLINALDERAKIADGLAAAEKGKELDAAHKRVDQELAQARNDGQQRIADAEKRARRSPKKSRPTPRLKPPASSPRRRPKQNSNREGARNAARRSCRAGRQGRRADPQAKSIARPTPIC
jgi:hypothetical protein